jgi:tRNA(Ile)-lysidine synthase
MRLPLPPFLPIDTMLLRPGMRLAAGVSGGADSVALLRALDQRSVELGLALHVAHLHHGLRGAEADGDLEFVRALAAELGLPFHEGRVDAAAEAAAQGETLEEAARRLRYGWFRQLMAAGEVEAVATAHTRDDQAETVLAKFLRGAWTEGFSGIHPAVEFAEGRVVRPLLGATRAEVEAYLHGLGQGWREDSSNRHLTFTRNRIRHELLPLLEGWNPRLREHLAQMAVLARDEEAWWQAELERLAPQMLLPGRPVRGGGRAAGHESGGSLSIEVARLAALAPALQRRLLRHAAGQLGAAPDFAATEALRELGLFGRAGQRSELAQGLRGERTHRELRLKVVEAAQSGAAAVPEYPVMIPGEVAAPVFGLRLRIGVSGTVRGEAGVSEEGLTWSEKLEGQPAGAEHPAEKSLSLREISEKQPSGAKALADLSGVMRGLKPPPPSESGISAGGAGRVAMLRNWRPGDRVRLRYSNGPRKVKEVLERLRVTGTSRALWPVLELEGRIVWMRGVELEPTPGVEVSAADLSNDVDGTSE